MRCLRYSALWYRTPWGGWRRSDVCSGMKRWSIEDASNSRPHCWPAPGINFHQAWRTRTRCWNPPVSFATLLSSDTCPPERDTRGHPPLRPPSPTDLALESRHVPRKRRRLPHPPLWTRRSSRHLTGLHPAERDWSRVPRELDSSRRRPPRPAAFRNQMGEH
jgi:hypothetical protein